MASRKNSDEYYVIDLCDDILGLKASRQHTFDFLRGDGQRRKKLPVDAYYAELNLGVEYRERQHTESVAFFNKAHTVSGVSRDEQRRLYDERRREVLPEHGIRLVEISYAGLKHNGRKRLLRDRQADRRVLERMLNQPDNQTGRNMKEMVAPPASKKHTYKQPANDGTQTWIYKLYRKTGCLFMLAVVFGTVILSSYLTLSVFHLDEGLALFIVLTALFVVPMVCHHYTTAVDERLDKGRSKRKITSSTYSDADSFPVCCPQCGSSNIGPTGTGAFVCMDCGISWTQNYG